MSLGGRGVNGRIDLLKKLAAVVGASILIFTGVCYATDEPAHSCRDNSVLVTKGVAKPAQPAEAGSSSRNTKGAGPAQHSVLLTWKAPAGVVKGYIIQRKELPRGDYATITVGYIPETSCTDYEASPGHSYVYQAKSVGTSGRLSRPSNPAKATIPNP